ncbi:MAG: hypothetical protein ACK5HT_02950 [Draconibacterium sp.]
MGKNIKYTTLDGRGKTEEFQQCVLDAFIRTQKIAAEGGSFTLSVYQSATKGNI